MTLFELILLWNAASKELEIIPTSILNQHISHNNVYLFKVLFQNIFPVLLLKSLIFAKADSKVQFILGTSVFLIMYPVLKIVQLILEEKTQKCLKFTTMGSKIEIRKIF